MSGLYRGRDPLGQLLSSWRIAAVLPLIHGRDVVDLACGDNRLIRRLGHGVGVDIRDYGNVDLVQPDLTRLPFADRSVDTVTILAALNYFDDPAATLREIHRVLRDDGRLIVTFLDHRASALWHKLRDTSLPRIAFSEAELRRLLAPAGLEIAGRRPFMLGLNRAYSIRKSPPPAEGPSC